VAATVTAPAAGAAGSNSLTVTASEYTYKLSGIPKSGWTQVTLNNTGTEYHMMLAVSLKKGTTLAQVKTAVAAGDPQTALQSIGSNGFLLGMPFFVGPGEKTTTIAKLNAGHYAILCFLTAPDGTPHAAHGMIKILDVGKAKSNLTPPKKGVVDASTSDSAITLPNGTLPAHGWVKVATTASEPRDFTIAQYATSTTTFEEANQYFNDLFSTGKPAASAPAVIVGNISSFPKGTVVYLQLDLKPGRHAVVSDTDSDDDGSKAVHQDIEVK
jgi:hypothetical protein